MPNENYVKGKRSSDVTRLLIGCCQPISDQFR